MSFIKRKIEFRNTLELNDKYADKFSKWSKIGFIYIAVCTTAAQIVFAIFHLVLLIILNLDDKYGYSLTLSIFWYISGLSAIQTMGSLVATVYSFTLITRYYLKLRFRQIYDTLKRFSSNSMSLYKFKNFLLYILKYLTESQRILFKKLFEHNDCCKLTDDLNKNERVFWFIYYYLIVPIIDLAVIVVMNENNVSFRYGLVFVVYITILNLFTLNYILAIVSRESYLLHKLLNSLIANKSLNLKLKYKTLSLIERLSGPEIGFYCLDLFPLNNYEFYIFCVNCISNFFLILDLFE